MLLVIVRAEESDCSRPPVIEKFESLTVICDAVYMLTDARMLSELDCVNVKLDWSYNSTKPCPRVSHELALLISDDWSLIDKDPLLIAMCELELIVSDELDARDTDPPLIVIDP